MSDCYYRKITKTFPEALARSPSSALPSLSKEAADLGPVSIQKVSGTKKCLLMRFQGPLPVANGTERPSTESTEVTLWKKTRPGKDPQGDRQEESGQTLLPHRRVNQSLEGIQKIVLVSKEKADWSPKK